MEKRPDQEKAREAAKNYIGEYIVRARKAQAVFEKMTQKETDHAVQAVAKAVFDNAEYLAEIAVEETGMGNIPDKTFKNKNKASIIWNSLRGKVSKGIIERDPLTGITKIAKPIGVVAAVTPCTNPIVTPMSNTMFAIKGGNAIIVTPHHKAIRCSIRAVELINEALSKLGIPENLVQILGQQSRENTQALISAADVVIATGGMGMVHAAYSSGRPALGVGTGNVQAIIDRDADIPDAVSKIAGGRAFDNGIICSGEQSVIYPREFQDQILAEFEKNGGLVIREFNQREALRNAIFEEGAMRRHAIGQSACKVAALAGLDVPENTRLIVAVAEGAGCRDILAKEKMCPVIAAYSYGDFTEAVEIARENLEVEGKGHSVAIHSNNAENIEYAGKELCVSRFVINQLCASGAGGSFKNGLSPTNTLGCGSWGHNSISENLTWYHLVNISRIAYHMENSSVPTEEELWGGSSI